MFELESDTHGAKKEITKYLGEMNTSPNLPPVTAARNWASC